MRFDFLKLLVKALKVIPIIKVPNVNLEKNAVLNYLVLLLKYFTIRSIKLVDSYGQIVSSVKY
jgi:nitrate reductase NapE component